MRCQGGLYVNVNVNNLLAISKLDLDNSGEPGPQAKGVNHLETPLRQLHATDRASSCAKRGGHVQLCSKPRGGTRNRTRDLRKKGSAFITSSDHWTNVQWSCPVMPVLTCSQQCTHPVSKWSQTCLQPVPLLCSHWPFDIPSMSPLLRHVVPTGSHRHPHTVPVMS